MKDPDIAFLRSIGLYEEAIEILEADKPMTITGPVMAAYLRVSYSAGRHSARDAYVWHDVAQLLGEPGA